MSDGALGTGCLGRVAGITTLPLVSSSTLLERSRVCGESNRNGCAFISLKHLRSVLEDADPTTIREGLD